MKKGIALLLALVCFATMLVSCDPLSNNGQTPEDEIAGIWGETYTLETAYAKAVELGYADNLESFLASIKGAAGVGISNIVVVGGNLAVILTNGTTIDCGSIKGEKGDKGDPGVGIADMYTKDGHLFAVLTDGKIIDCGALDGASGTPDTPGGELPNPELPDPEFPDNPPVEPVNWYDNVDFDGATIEVQLSNLEDMSLFCGCQKYMQGPESLMDTSNGGYEKVYNEVLLRNEAARETLGLYVQYDYIARDWSTVIGYISDLEASGNGMDMYCDMMYDMAGLSYRNGVFANILKYTQDDSGINGWTEGAGYFKLTNENGYMVDLMKDMSLSDDKQFLIAGDYYMDVIRGMYVMPFNASLYTTYINPSDADCGDLYDAVSAGTWTWDALMAMNTIYLSDAPATIYSDYLLMALSVGGLSATGLIYSTAFKSYTVNSNGAYILNENAGDLVNIFRKAGELATTKGVATTPKTEQEGVAQAQAKFTYGEALFAGPTLLSAVETPEFSEMDQLSILPVPKLGKFVDYNTAISSRARVGALGFGSEKKKETSAWIQYCTENSYNVRAEYFDKAASSKYLSGTSETREMLEFIYDHIDENKSMILDLMVLSNDWMVGSDYCWDRLIKGDAFTQYQNDLHSVYTEAITAKQDVLDDIMSSWATADP